MYKMLPSHLSRVVIDGLCRKSSRFVSSKFGAKVLEKNKILAASSNLTAFPEYNEIEKITPWGSEGRNILISKKVADKRLAQAKEALERVEMIAQSMGALGSPMLLASYRRALSVAESYSDYSYAATVFEKFEKASVNIIGKDDMNLDTLSSYERANLGEIYLSYARFLLLSIKSPSDISKIDNIIDRLILVLPEIHDMDHISPDDFVATGAFIPAYLTYERALALDILVTKLKGKVLYEDEKKLLKTSTNVEGENGKSSRPLSHQELLRNKILDNLNSLDAFASGTIDIFGNSSEDRATGKQTCLYTQFRTAEIRARVHRNTAFSYLLDVVRLISSTTSADSVPGSSSSDILESSGVANVASSHLSAAITSYNDACKLLDDTISRFEAVAEHDSQEYWSGTSPIARNNAYRRVMWDLRRSRSICQALHAESSILMGLWVAWVQMGSLSPPKSHSNSSNSQALPLFPLSQDQMEVIAPIISLAESSASESLRARDVDSQLLMEAASPTGSESTESPEFAELRKKGCYPLETSEAGGDLSVGTALPLLSHALLNFMTTKFVSVEGLLRTIIDSFITVSLSCTSRSPTSGTAPLHPSSPEEVGQVLTRLPLWQLAHVQSAVLVYSALLKQWEKRESEAKAWKSVAELLHHTIQERSGVSCVIDISKRAPILADVEEKERLDFLIKMTFALAFKSADIGSFSTISMMDFVEL